MNKLTILENKTIQLPDFGEDVTKENNTLQEGVGTGIPFLRIDGKKFVVMEGKEKTPIDKEINGVIITAGPISRRFYKAAFNGHITTRPDCASTDGIKADSGISHPEATSCEGCPNNVWGSKKSMSGGKGKLCSDYRRLAVFIPGTNKIYRMDVPAASLGVLAAYGRVLTGNDVPISAVLTKITFDPTSSFPKLAFDAIEVFSFDKYATYKAMKYSQIVTAIMTMGVSHDDTLDEQETEETTPPVAPPKEAKEAVKVDSAEDLKDILDEMATE